MKLFLPIILGAEALETFGTGLNCEDPLLGENSKRLNENVDFPDQGTVMYVCDPEYFGQSGSYTTIKELVLDLYSNYPLNVFISCCLSEKF